MGPPLPHRLAREAAVALAAQGIPYRLARREDGTRILVPPAHAAQAQAELEAVLGEADSPAPPTPSAPAGAEPWAVVPLLALGVFGVVSAGAVPGCPIPRTAWLAAGSAAAEAIGQGEVWRVLTALTLHADGGHLAANLLAGGVFLHLAAQRWGAGAAWLATVLAAGAAGLLVALTLGPGHDSVGFSTAVFAAVGLTAWSRRLPPAATIALGLAFLAFLGTEGEHTDLPSHGAGLVAGLAAGALLRRVSRPGPRTNALLLALAMALPALAWVLALG